MRDDGHSGGGSAQRPENARHCHNEHGNDKGSQGKTMARSLALDHGLMLAEPIDQVQLFGALAIHKAARTGVLTVP